MYSLPQKARSSMSTTVVSPIERNVIRICRSLLF